MRRSRAGEDRRQVLLGLTPKGEKVLRELSMGHKAELRTQGPALVAALERAMRPTKGARGSASKAPSNNRGSRLNVPEPSMTELRRFHRSQPTIAATGTQVGDTTLAEPAQFRMVLVSFLAAAIGLIAGGIAFLLYKLIGLLTNISFYGRFAADFTSARHNHLGLWVIPIPVIGGLIVGVMAKYGSSKIKGHGIPEAMEAVLFNRSRIQPRVAILKPISAAIAIGTGGPFGAEGPIIQTGGAVGSLVGQIFQPPLRSAKFCWPAAPRPACRQLSTRRSPA